MVRAWQQEAWLYYDEMGNDWPERIQRQRTKGWRMPVGAVYVGRPSFWGNPFKVGETVGIFDLPGIGDGARRYRARLQITPQLAVVLYSTALFQSEAGRERLERIDELRGHDLVCWCPLDEPCHADVLRRIANPHTRR